MYSIYKVVNDLRTYADEQTHPNEIIITVCINTISIQPWFFRYNCVAVDFSRYSLGPKYISICIYLSILSGSLLSYVTRSVDCDKIKNVYIYVLFFFVALAHHYVVTYATEHTYIYCCHCFSFLVTLFLFSWLAVLSGRHFLSL